MFRKMGGYFDILFDFVTGLTVYNYGVTIKNDKLKSGYDFFIGLYRMFILFSVVMSVALVAGLIVG